MKCRACGVSGERGGLGRNEGRKGRGREQRGPDAGQEAGAAVCMAGDGAGPGGTETAGLHPEARRGEGPGEGGERGARA